jgi:hypothetical protein
MSRDANGNPIVAGAIKVGAAGKELFRQGTCVRCEITLWGYEPILRDLCGTVPCEPLEEESNHDRRE